MKLRNVTELVTVDLEFGEAIFVGIRFSVVQNMIVNNEFKNLEILLRLEICL
jgi:hypothetical protein